MEVKGVSQPYMEVKGVNLESRAGMNSSCGYSPGEANLFKPVWSVKRDLKPHSNSTIMLPPMHDPR